MAPNMLGQSRAPLCWSAWECRRWRIWVRLSPCRRCWMPLLQWDTSAATHSVIYNSVCHYMSDHLPCRSESNRAWDIEHCIHASARECGVSAHTMGGRTASVYGGATRRPAVAFSGVIRLLTRATCWWHHLAMSIDLVHVRLIPCWQRIVGTMWRSSVAHRIMSGTQCDI